MVSGRSAFGPPSTLFFILALMASGCRHPNASPASPAGLPSPPPPPPTVASVPQLPKLPEWTLNYTLPKGLAIQSDGEDLGKVYDRIRQALYSAGIGTEHSSVYAVGVDGFAIVTHVEYIDDHGVPLDPRWGVRPSQKNPTTLAEFWRALFTANPGRYRVLVIVVTSHTLQSVKASSHVATPEELSKLERSGEDRLPDAMRRIPGTPDRRCVAIIYEFYRQSSSDEPKQLESSSIEGPDHLAAAGMWFGRSFN